MLELPLFILIPSFYHQRGVPLEVIGIALLVIRGIDAIFDPWIGQQIDRSTLSYRQWIYWSLPLAMLGFGLSFHPVVGAEWLLVWMLATSALTYLSYSVLSVSYLAWGANLGVDAKDKARVTAWREGLGLFGVMLAASMMKTELLTALVLTFVGLSAFAVAALATLNLPNKMQFELPFERPRAEGNQQPLHRQAWYDHWSLLWSHSQFGKLMTIFLFNGIASAIPATLITFFVQENLHLAERLPLFLMSYFAVGALGMPLWLGLAKRYDLKLCWLLGMCLSIVAFAGAFALGEGDFWPFLVICCLTGLALGADLALPSALLAALIQTRKESLGLAKSHRLEASYFGLWSLATKANLAFAAGLSLPLLGLLGEEQRPLALSLTYAALPCALKFVAVVLLARFKPFEYTSGK